MLVTLRRYVLVPQGEKHHGGQQDGALRVLCCLYVLLTVLAAQDIHRMPCHWTEYPLLFPALSL